MKTAMLAMALLLSLCVSAQTPTAVSQPPAAPPDINTVLTDLSRVAMVTNGDIGKLRIDKWKTETSQKQQMQQVADSLQRNITTAIPGLIAEVQSSQGSVSKTFKLYHNINVVYEFLNSLAESTGAFGKKEEYEPLATDVNALDNVRQSLSSYIEQAANTMESRARQGTTAAQNSQSTQKGPKKIVIDDAAPTTKKKSTKKKTAPPQ